MIKLVLVVAIAGSKADYDYDYERKGNTLSNNNSAWIVETTDNSFQPDVLDRSGEVPIVVDFWAEWCAPCRMLGPTLEELADEYAGKFILAKVDTEKAPKVAQQFNISSIPAVFAIVQGEPVDSFLGALSKDEIRPWLDRVIGHAALSRAASLEQSDLPAAETLYRELRKAAPDDAAVTIGLARVLLAQDHVEECSELLESLAARGFLEPEAEKLKTQLAYHALKTEDLEASRAAVATAPTDLSLQLRLAEILAANDQHREAFDIVLELLAKDRHGMGESGREMMVEMFRLLPEDSELLTEYRRKLSLALY